MKHLLTLGFFCLLAASMNGQTTIWSLDFETAGGYTTSDPEFVNSPEDYYTRTNGSNIGASFSNIQGNYYFAGQDIDDQVASLPVTLNVQDIDITNFIDITFKIRIAEDDASDGQEDWDAGDYMHISFDIDNSGSFTELLWVENVGGGSNNRPAIDTDFDGEGDGTEITDDFQEFSAQLHTTGSELDLKIEFNLDSGDEDIAIDSMILIGKTSSSLNAWINEFHYDNASTDVNEFVEIVIEEPGAYSLGDFTITLYNGSNGETYDSETVNNITTGSTYGNFSIYYWEIAGIQNGDPDGLSLDYQGNLIQFISYEGTFTASGGPADGEISTDIGVSESNSSTLSTESLQLGGGFGRMYSQFSWNGPASNTKGDENNDQILPEIYWDGTSWNAGAPTSATGADDVFVDGSNASSSSDVDVNNLGVSASSAYTQSSATLTLNGDLTNNGTVTIADGASLLTTDASANLDGIDVQRTGTQYNNVFNYWSTPVDGATYDDVWTFGAANNEYNQSDLYTYDIFNQDFSNVSTIGNPLPIGKGVAMTGLIGGGTNTLTFTGTPNNGEITTAVINNSGVEDYALLGNPYPSAIDADQFIDDNTSQGGSGSVDVISGTLWFWDVDITKDTFVSNDYATYTKAGATNNNPHGPNFNGFIAACQGFMVESTANSNALFRNSQRVAGNNSQFFKEGSIQRVWVVASNPSTTSNGILIAFSVEATNQYDQGWDGKKLKGNPNIAFYSKLNDEDYAIQTFPPMTEGKIIPLGLDAGKAGEYTISIDSIDGIPTDVDILLEDQSTGNFYDLRESDYTFSVNEATTIDNLRLHFRRQSTGTNVTLKETLVNVWQSGDALIIKDLGNAPISHIKVVDLSGRTLSFIQSPTSTLQEVQVGDWPSGVYLVEIASERSIQTEKVFIK